MDRELERAVYKASRYGEYLNQSEYYTLLKWAKISGPDGRAAQDALASAKDLNYEPFKYIWNRDKYTEDSYGALGSSRVTSGGCYITTACLAALKEDFDDKCYELETLRHYRDTWLRENHPDEIKIYYERAPKLVEAINTRTDHMEIYRNIYRELVIPSIHAIESNDMELAETIYRTEYLKLEEEYGEETENEQR